MAESACFPSCMITFGIQIANRMGPRTNVLGVLLKLNLTINFGATAPQTVSIVSEK